MWGSRCHPRSSGIIRLGQLCGGGRSCLLLLLTGGHVGVNIRHVHHLSLLLLLLLWGLLRR